MMYNKNRLINDFKVQTKTTIWKHLEIMAACYPVYSTRLKGLAPFLQNYDVYIYAYDTNVVVMCLDSCGSGEKNIYEESETLSPIIYSEGCEPRISAVGKLAETVQLVKERLQKRNDKMKVLGVLLTEAEITNSYELSQLWTANNIMVIDELKRLKHKQIEVNMDDTLECKAYVDIIIDTADEFAATMNPFADPPKLVDDFIKNEDWDDDGVFTKMLNAFLSKDMEIVDEEEDETTDAEFDHGFHELPEPEDEEEYNEDEEDEDEVEEKEDDYDMNDDVIPVGEIEQNLNLSVKVKILRPIPNPRRELEKLVGCEDIKRRMDELVALTQYNKMMQKSFPLSKQHEVSLHSVFLGRPGTGKTTVCKIFGSLLHQAGALSKGHVVMCDRGTFIGTLWGDEERSMNQVLEMAKGGVLMIDEAYLLNGKHESDPGKLVIQLLMNILADETQRDIAVVLCGYKEPMQKLLDSNPGLQSRFPNKFEFTDFSIEELLEITRRRVREYEYEFTPEAWDKYRDVLAEAYQQRDPQTWGNARFIGNLLDRIYIQHAKRCVRERPTEKGLLRLLTPDDICQIEVPKPRPSIGFAISR